MDNPRKTHPTMRGTTLAIAETAREMRREPTVAEAALWEALRGGKLNGLRFRRQLALGNYIVDFCCKSCMLVVEVDGTVHETLHEQDELRSHVLASFGYHVIRFTNGEVLSNLDEVIEKIQLAAKPPLPRWGEGVAEGRG